MTLLLYLRKTLLHCTERKRLRLIQCALEINTFHKIDWDIFTIFFKTVEVSAYLRIILFKFILGDKEL